MSHIIDVPISYKKDYSIYIGHDNWKDIKAFVEKNYTRRLAFVVIDEKVHNLHKKMVSEMIEHSFEQVKTFIVPEGEQSKSAQSWNQIINFILENEAERGTPLFAVGGGVTGDLAGFAASSALRGLPLVHIPTTLLAMVDSSIGGKTGVNHGAGKNLIGAFYQPDIVFANTEFLDTLEEEEWINGLSEILKYGAIRTPRIFETASHLIEEDGFCASEGWAKLIAQSASIKAEIVKEDTLESGDRAFLNFGHTFAHAIEKVAGYGTISHGQAVFIGMIAAIYASRQLGADIGIARFDSFKSLYPIELPGLVPNREKLTEAMKTDKKVKDGQIRLVLLNEWGAPYIHSCKDIEVIKEAWTFAYEQFSN